MMIGSKAALLAMAGVVLGAVISSPANAVVVQYTITFADPDGAGPMTGGTGTLTLNESTVGTLIENTPTTGESLVANLDGYSFTINLANYSQWHIDLAGGVFNNLGLTPAINYGVANTVFLDTYGGTNGGHYDLGRTQNSDLVNSAPFTIALAVPEPSTWAMLILGFAGIGFMAYRRQAKPSLSFARSR
jgi:PEP-CTERM motif